MEEENKKKSLEVKDRLEIERFQNIGFMLGIVLAIIFSYMADMKATGFVGIYSLSMAFRAFCKYRYGAEKEDFLMIIGSSLVAAAGFALHFLK